MDAITRVQCRLDELLKVHADAYQLAQGFSAPLSVDGEPLLVTTPLGRDQTYVEPLGKLSEKEYPQT